MKQQLAAIAYSEKELEAYVSQLKNLHFESISDVKKAEDGTYYQVMAKTVRENAVVPKAAAAIVEAVPV
jgi:hypothetical protein